MAAGFALIACSAEAMEAARASLQLCGEVLIPSLFPFFVLSGLIQELGLPSRLGRLAAPGMHRLFGVSGPGAARRSYWGSWRVIPRRGLRRRVGTAREIKREEGERLLGFCSNSGPPSCSARRARGSSEAQKRAFCSIFLTF
ncbi:MAG: hypothetical protein ACLTSG_12075 [Lachnospiraceae bacterium]